MLVLARLLLAGHLLLTLLIAYNGCFCPPACRFLPWLPLYCRSACCCCCGCPPFAPAAHFLLLLLGSAHLLPVPCRGCLSARLPAHCWPAVGLLLFMLNEVVSSFCLPVLLPAYGRCDSEPFRCCFSSPATCLPLLLPVHLLLSDSLLLVASRYHE